MRTPFVKKHWDEPPGFHDTLPRGATSTSAAGKAENLFAERQVVTGVSEVSYDISRLPGIKRAASPLTHKKYYDTIPLAQEKSQDGDGEDDNSQKAI
jgi:hypothetical protein